MDKEALWSLLLDSIEDGRVVPIIGPSLLTIPGTEGQYYYTELAARLAKEVGVDTEEGYLPDLNTVACLYMKKGRLDDLYDIVRRLAGDQEAPLPKALLQLAAIPAFRLFVTTTFDSLLMRALNEARPQAPPTVLSFTLSKTQDLSLTSATDQGTTIYHLFGKFSPRPGNYALTQEDILEFMYSMQSEKRPANLYKELADNSLLILGNRFGGWLARFFLRLIRRERLSIPTKAPSFLAEPEIALDKGMTLFVENFSRDTRIFPSDGPVEFVDELYTRWTKLHPGAVNSRPDPNLTSDQGPFIFISYADEDVKCVEQIEKALDGSGMNVFFDKARNGSGLLGGDSWDSKLKRKIRGCSLFMPIVSKHVLTSDNRYFRTEWKIGIDTYQQSPAYYSSSDSDVFMLPVLIDNTSNKEPRIPDEFKKPMWITLPNGLPTPEFIERVKSLYRFSQQAKGAAR